MYRGFKQVSGRPRSASRLPLDQQTLTFRCPLDAALSIWRGEGGQIQAHLRSILSEGRRDQRIRQVCLQHFRRSTQTRDNIHRFRHRPVGAHQGHCGRATQVDLHPVRYKRRRNNNQRRAEQDFQFNPRPHGKVRPKLEPTGGQLRAVRELRQQHSPLTFATAARYEQQTTTTTTIL